jgi:hypothetical protein
MLPLELVVLLGIISAFTAFAFILAWASRGDGKFGPTLNPAPRRVAVTTHPTAPYDRARSA